MIQALILKITGRKGENSKFEKETTTKSSEKPGESVSENLSRNRKEKKE